MFKQSTISAIAVVALSLSARAEPLDKPVKGPKLLCFKYSVFSLDAGERVTDFSGSPELMLIKIKSSVGTYEISESEILVSSEERKRLVYSNGEMSVYRVFGSERQYEIYGPTSFSRGEVVPLLWLSGAALRSTTTDGAIFRRFDVRDPRSAKCDQKFTYSW